MPTAVHSCARYQRQVSRIIWYIWRVQGVPGTAVLAGLDIWRVQGVPGTAVLAGLVSFFLWLRQVWQLIFVLHATAGGPQAALSGCRGAWRLQRRAYPTGPNLLAAVWRSLRTKLLISTGLPLLLSGRSTPSKYRTDRSDRSRSRSSRS